MANCTFDEYSLHQSEKLSTWHSEKNENNISAVLLNILKMYGKKLKKNSLNETKNLSFRDLARFCLVSETKIIEKDSPIYDGQVIDKTMNKSLFKLLLTGEDDDELNRIENPEIKKSHIKGKIEIIKSEIEKQERFLLEANQKIGSLSDEQIEQQVQNLIKLVDEAHKSVQHEEEIRAVAWKELDQLISVMSQNEEIRKRFELLNKHYVSDLNRLEFVNEGKHLLDQVKEVNCPLCDRLIDQKLLEPYEEKDEGFLISVKSEFFKIQKKKEELILTTVELDEKIEFIKKQIEEKKERLQKIDEYIAEKLQPVYKINDGNLKKLLDLKTDKGQMTLVQSQLAESKKDLAYYNMKIDEKQDRAPETIIPEKIYLELAAEIKNVLVSWGIECQKIVYDPSENDIEIDGEKRRNSGKGYRAIYLSGFMVGVLLFCLKKNLKHPNFLVLDSPLTTYKERDLASFEQNSKDKIPEEIQTKFYEALANLPEINKVQIVVIENRDPPQEILEKINYIHFTKNEKVGRYGFYPL